MKVITIIDGLAFRPEDVHGVLMRIRNGWLKYRLSKQANDGFGYSADLRSKYPLVPVTPCPLEREACSGCSACVSPLPVFDDDTTIIRSSVHSLPSYCCKCALTGDHCR